MTMSASPLVVWAMASLAILVAVLVIVAVWISTRAALTTSITAVMVLALMAAQYAIASTGVLRGWDRRPPPLVLLIAVTVALTLGFAFSRLGANIAARTSWALLIGSQVFRFPLELTMHRASTEGVMPVQMSYSGYNFDIITGIGAFVVSSLFVIGRGSRRVVIVWNAAGLCLLVNIVAIAIASLPLFRAFGEDRLNVWVTYPPFVWLPGILVPFALLGHVLVWRKLRITKKTSAT